MNLLRKIILFILLVGCNKTTNELASSMEVVDLQLTSGRGIAFNDLYTTKGIYSLSEKHPNYYETLLKEYGVERKDSIVISTLFTDYNKFYYYLYKRGFYSKNQLIEKNIDSIIEESKLETKPYSVAVRSLNNKKILTFDENRNNDFSDDITFSFDEKSQFIGADSNFTNNLPFFNYNELNTINSNRKIFIYPSLNDELFRPTKDSLVKKSRLMVKFKDHWEGDLKMKSKNYKVVIQGMYKSFLSILIKPDSINFSNDNYVFNENFSYRLKDTIDLSNELFIIDCISDNISKLILKKIDSFEEFYGRRMGQKIKNFSLKDLSNQEFKIYKKSENKKYTLLDFWGTWCKPCKELTPILKSFENKFSNDLRVIGIAYGNNIEDVKEYVESNKMNWKHSFIDRSNNNIIKDLEIKQFPTFILLDSSQKIIYRDSGKNALTDIESLINKLE